MEYIEHLILLILVPVGLIIPLSLLWLLKCQGRSVVRSEIVKVILGDQFLEHTTTAEPDDDPESHGRRTQCRIFVAYISAVTVLALTAGIWWISLVEQISVGICVKDADCFMVDWRAIKFKIPDRVINCSNINQTNDFVLVCYKPGFYLIDAFARSGGVLAIVSTTAKLYFPAIIACANGRRECYCIAGSVTGCVGILSMVAFFTLLFVLPTKSLYLVAGSAGLPYLVILTAIIFMSISACKLNYRTYHPDYEALGINLAPN